MVELAIWVAAFLFLCWVAFQGFAIIAAMDKKILFSILAIVGLLLLRWWL
jgi:hypothetical protein